MKSSSMAVEFSKFSPPAVNKRRSLVLSLPNIKKVPPAAQTKDLRLRGYQKTAETDDNIKGVSRRLEPPTLATKLGKWEGGKSLRSKN